MEVLKTMMNKVEVEELINVLEGIRSTQYPDIPPELIRGIVETQFESQDDRAASKRNTKKLIDDFLKQSMV